jgi:hypothetical protein
MTKTTASGVGEGARAKARARARARERVRLGRFRLTKNYRKELMKLKFAKSCHFIDKFP